MRGFIPKHERQHLAEGGVIGRVKQIFGMDEERNARIRAYKEGKATAAAAPPAPAPAAAPAPAPAISDYSGMSATQRREKALGLANGGMVRGPGTGTSDDIPADLPEGSYIMPADSTAQIGEQALQGMGGGARGFVPGRGKKVPVQISNGEFNLTPDQVHAVGVQALDGMKDATHRPARGFTPRAKAAPEEPRQFFAGGGVVEEERKPGSINWPYTAAEAGRSPYVSGAAPAAAPAPATPSPNLESKVASIPTGGTRPAPAADGSQNSFSNTEVGRNVVNTLSAVPGLGGVGRVASTGGAISSGLNAASRTVNSAAAAGAGAIAAPSMAAAQPVAPAMPTGQPAGGASAEQSPSVVSAPMSVKSSVPEPGAAAEPTAAPGAKEIAPGIYRSGNSYGDSAQAASTGPAATGRPSAQNDQAAANLSARGFQPGWTPTAAENPTRGFTPGVVAPTALHSGNSWQARNDLRNMEVSASSIMNRPEWNRAGRADVEGKVAQYTAARAGDIAARGAQPGLDQAAMNANAAIQREGVQQAGANQRAARGFQVDMGRLAIEGRRAGAEERRAADESTARGFQTRAARQQEELRNTLIDPNATPAQRQQAQAALQTLNGKGDSWKPVALQGGTDAQGNKTESILGAVNERTGEMKRMEGQAAVQMPSANHIAALKANPAQAAQFDEVYGKGAAAKALGG